MSLCWKKVPPAGLARSEAERLKHTRTLAFGISLCRTDGLTLIFLISLPRASFAGYSSLVMISSGSPVPCCCPPCPRGHTSGWGL
jgi:hypothetical protein